MALATQTLKANDPRVIRMAEAMRDAHCPQDQAKIFLTSGYVPLPAMLPFHAAARDADRSDGPDEIALGGTRGPGKSHAIMAQVGLDDCQRVAGLKWLFLRKVQKSAAESFEDLVYKILRYVKHEYKPSLGRVTFPNGSRILLGGFNNESDIDKYLGIEYDGVVVEEATQLSERKIQMIGGSVRSTVPGWRARRYYSANPDGIGLQWFKKKFVIPWRMQAEHWTRFIEGDWRNNPFLRDEYIRYLDGLTGVLRRAWRDKDWDAFEGMALPYWSQDTMVINPFPVPLEWLKWRAVDDGYSAPWCCLWMTQDPVSKRRYVYREAYRTMLTNPQQADLINDMTPPEETISFDWADPAMWGRDHTKITATSAADEYKARGIQLRPADNDRIQGKRRVDSAFAPLGDGLPGLQIFSTCHNLIRTLPTLPYDPIRTEDVDTKAEDHAYDTLRYGLTNLRLPDPPSTEPELVYNPLESELF